MSNFFINLPPVEGGGSTPTEYDAGNSGSAITIDWTNGVNQLLTLTANCTITFANPVIGQNYTLIISQGATGGWVPTISGDNINYADSSHPTWATYAYQYDSLNIYYDTLGYTIRYDGPYLDVVNFTPLSIPNCELFVISTIPSSLPSAVNNTAQTTWLDQSTNAYTFQQTSGSAKPIYHSTGFGSKNVPYLHFDGAVQYMKTTTNEPVNLTGNPNFTLFIAYQADTTTQSAALCGWGEGNDVLGAAGVLFSPDSVYALLFAGGNTVPSKTNYTTSPSIFTAQKTAGPINTGVNLRANGTQLPLNSALTSNTPSIEARPFCIGIFSNYTPLVFLGKIAAFIVFSRVLTADEVGMVETYLNYKLGCY